MNRILLILLALAAPLVAAAQQPALGAGPGPGAPPAPGPVVPLAQVLDLTAQHYPSIRARRAELEAARYGVRERQDDYLPKTVFQLQALYSTSNQVQGAFYPNEGSAIPVVGSIKPTTNTGDLTWTSGSTLYTDWAFFTFGRVRAGVRVAQDEVATRQAALDNEIFQQQIQAADAYLLLLVNDEIARRYAANVRRAEVFWQATVARAAAGLRPGADSSLAGAEVARARLLLTQARQAAQQQRLRLAELTGLPAATLAVDSAGFYRRLPTPASTPGAEVPDAHPVLRQALAEVQRQQDAARLARRAWLPGIRLFAAGFTRGSGIDNQKAPDGGLIYHKGLWDGVKFRAYDVMVGPLTYWNLTDGLRARNLARQADYLAQGLQYDLAAQRLGLQRQNEAADLALTYSTASVAAATLQLAAAQAAYRQGLARYQAGLANAVELTQVVTVLNRAEVDYAVAVAGTWQGLLKKAAATGNLAVFTSQAK